MPMHEPSLDELMTNVDSRYTLVVVTAKRARQLTEEAQKQEAEDNLSATGKPVTEALYEMAQGNIQYKRVKESIK